MIALLSSPGLECVHLTVGLRDRFGIVLVYCCLHNPAFSLPELAEFISTAVLKLSRLLIVEDNNIHTELELFGPALEFMDSMTAINLSQHVTCPMH